MAAIYKMHAFAQTLKGYKLGNVHNGDNKENSTCGIVIVYDKTPIGGHYPPNQEVIDCYKTYDIHYLQKNDEYHGLENSYSHYFGIYNPRFVYF
jgi:hypothetical protein